MFGKWMGKIIAGCCLLAISGCGGSSSSSYTIGIDPTWSPLELMGKENLVLGFSTDILQEIALSQHVKLYLLKTNPDTLPGGLLKKKYQGILSSMQPYLFNEKDYDFSEMYLQTGPVLVTAVSSPIKSMTMLSGKEIAVFNSDDAALLEKYPGVLVRFYDSIPKALNDVEHETIDGAIVYLLEAQSYCQDLYQGKLKIATPPLTNTGLRLVTLHDRAPGLLRAFNDGLRELKSNGKYKELAAKWGMPE